MAEILGLLTLDGGYLLSVDADPSASSGAESPVSSYAMAQDGSGLYYKFDTADTDWSRVTLDYEAPKWLKVTKTYQDFSTAGLTNNITILTLPIKGYIHDIKIVPTTAFSGGTIATYTLSVGIAGNLTKYVPTTNVFTGNTTATDIHVPNSGIESTSGTTAIKAEAISTVGNLSAATAGSVDFYILVSIVP